MRSFGFAAITALLVLTAACDSDDPLGGNGGDARVTILLTDAPGDVLSAVVTISAIYLQGSDDEDGEGGRVHLLDEPVTTDLLTLADDVLLLVDEEAIESGHYGQLRFVIDGAYIEVETETGTAVYSTPDYDEAPEQVDGTLMCPSCAQSGLKVNFTGGLDIDDEATLLIDFDVADSFGHQAGQSGKWIMQPTLRGSVIEE